MNQDNFRNNLESDSLLIPLLNAFPFYAFLLDKNHRILFANNKLLNDLNVGEEEVTGNYCHGIIHKTVLPVDECPLEEAIRSDKPVERKFFDKNLNKWTLSTIFPILWKDKDGNGLFLHLIQEVTHVNDEEDIPFDYKENIRELTSVNKEIILRVSHELQTPIASMELALQMLLENYKDQLSNDVVNLIEIIQRGERRLKNLIDNVIDVSKVELGRIKLNIQKENLVEVINDCIDVIDHMAKKRQISITKELPETSYLNFDKLRIEQVILNLLSNAIKYTPSSGNIFVKLIENEQYVDLSIKDTGIGLIEEEQKQIFKKFGKIERDNSKYDLKNEGTGLGLYISRKLVKLHNFRLRVKSEGRNKGSTFIVRMHKD
jgi:signal transduction histidine kinase